MDLGAVIEFVEINGLMVRYKAWNGNKKGKAFIFATTEYIYIKSLGSRACMGEHITRPAFTCRNMPRHGTAVKPFVHLAPGLFGEALAVHVSDFQRRKITGVDAGGCKPHTCFAVVLDIQPDGLNTAVINRDSKNGLRFIFTGYGC